MSYFDWTGNPWVDAGISAILALSEKEKPCEISLEDCEKVSEIVEKLYLTKEWAKNLYSVFPNSKFTNPSIKNKQFAIHDFFEGLINQFEELGTTGDCIACGRRKVSGQKNKSHIPLIGSVNSHYFTHTAEGADYCEVCTFATQCSPLVYYRCGNPMVIHSNSEKVLRYWGEKSIENIREQLSTKYYTGIFNEGYKNPHTAIFHIAQDFIIKRDSAWSNDKPLMRIYHFSNYGQGPELTIYDLPNNVFNFLAYLGSAGFYDDWKAIVKRGYKKNIKDKDEEEYRNYHNQVYYRLLNNISILSFFISIKYKKAYGNWGLISKYLMEVRYMEKKRIEVIKKLADSISTILTELPNGKRRLSNMESAKYYQTFCIVLFKLNKDNVSIGNKTPLIEFDEYVELLFPEGAFGWKEIQNLILFRVYENLHEWLLKEKWIDIETDEEDLLEEETLTEQKN